MQYPILITLNCTDVHAAVKVKKLGGWHVEKPENPFQLQAGSQGHILLIHEIVDTCLQTGLAADSDNQHRDGSMFMLSFQYALSCTQHSFSKLSCIYREIKGYMPNHTLRQGNRLHKSALSTIIKGEILIERNSLGSNSGV